MLLSLSTIHFQLSPLCVDIYLELMSIFFLFSNCNKPMVGVFLYSEGIMDCYVCICE